jgi:hypothetical protein
VKPAVARRRSQLAFSSAALLVALGGWWLLWRGASATPLPVAARASEPEPSPVAQSIPARTQPALEHAADGIAIMPADPSQAPTDEPVHPHPHTPIHERIYRENNLKGQLDGAMDVKDAAGMRRLLAEYRDQYPEDAHYLQEGYGLIADCIEHPSDATRSAAERYYQDHRASLLRRYVRRHCLQPDE